MTIYPLPEGQFTIGHDKVFIPFSPEKDVLEDRSRGSLLVEVQPFLIITKQDIMVLDTGLGMVTDGEMQIHQLLRGQGLEPESVTKVLLSHLHKDHAGGLMDSSGGILRPAFPLADYYIYRKEAEYAKEKGLPSYHPADIEPLLSSGQVTWLEGGKRQHQQPH